MSTTSAARAPTPPMSGTGSRKPNIARLGIVCTRLAIATSGDGQARPAGREDRRAARRSPPRSASRSRRAGRARRRSVASSCWCVEPEADDGAHAAPVRDRGKRRARQSRSARTRGSSSIARSPAACRTRSAGRSSSTPMRSPSASASAMSCVTRITRLAHARLDAAELLLQLAARDRIERAERFVHQQHRRIGGQRPRDADALPLSAGQLVGPAVARTCRAAGRSARAARARERATRSSGHRSSRGTTAMLSATVRCGKQADVLNDVADRSPQADRIPLARVPALHEHLAGVGQQQPIDQLEDASSCPRRSRRPAPTSRRAPTVSEKSSRMRVCPARPYDTWRNSTPSMARL